MNTEMKDQTNPLKKIPIEPFTILHPFHGEIDSILKAEKVIKENNPGKLVPVLTQPVGMNQSLGLGQSSDTEPKKMRRSGLTVLRAAAENNTSK